VIEILRRSNIPLAGQNAVVVGRSDLVGKPVAMLLLNANATVTVCHSKTRDLPEVCRRGDILVAAIGKAGLVTNSNDAAKLGRPADMIVDPATNELYVADGYGNHRVIVFDAATGAYKRHWGAYGKPPTDDKITYDPKASMPQQFGNPVHCIRMSKDGLVYVCDRYNNRIQVFRKDGTFVTEFPVLKDTLPSATTGSVVFWPDAAQTYVLVSDDPNAEFHLLNRADGKYITSFGHMGHGAGEFDNLHNLAIDSKGNIYAAEVAGKRVQKFRNLGGL